MLIDRSHLSWALFSGISLIAGTVLYVSYAMHSPSGPSGGSAIGLLFGVLGTSMMLFAGLLAARKSVRVRRLGSAQFWLKGHLWLGTLCIPFILFHAGFGWGGFLEQLLWYTLALVAGSGFFGLAVQQFLPRLLWNQTPLETFEAQTPYQCDRMTFISDQQISALCGAPLNVPPDHLRDHISKLVRDYYDIVNGPGARGELNARKLQLLQQVSPPAVRDFFWAMAKYAKSEAKAIRFEGDFPELLVATYAGLKPQSSEASKPNTNNSHGSPKAPAAIANPPVSSQNEKREFEGLPVAGVEATAPKAPAAPKDTVAVKASESVAASAGPVNAPKLSPLELMKKKAEEKKAAGVASVPDNSGSTTSDTQKEEIAASPEKTKLSPLELMKSKAAEKKAAAQNSVTADEKPSAELTIEKPAAAVEQPAAKLSPLEQMRLKAAEKKAAAQGGGAQAVPVTSDEKPGAELTNEKPAAAVEQPAAKLSPLELMKLKAAEKKAAAQDGGAQAVPVTSDEKPGAELTIEKPAAAVEQPAAKLSPLEQMRLKAAEKKAAAQDGGAQAVPVTSDEKPGAELTNEKPAAAVEQPAAKLSPLELMKLKAAEKKAAAQGGGAQAVPVTSDEKPGAELTIEKPAAAVEQPAAKLSPLELMKLKAAEKKAAAQGGGAQAVPVTSDEKPEAEVTIEKPAAAVEQPAAKLSPLELMKLKAAEKKAAAQDGGAQAVPVTSDEKPGAELTIEKPAAAVEQPAAKLSPLELMKLKAAEKKAAAQVGGAPAVPVSEDEKPAAAAEPPAAMLSPLELMKKKAAEKALKGDSSKSADESASVPAKAPKSPLDMLKKNTDATPAAPPAKPVIAPKPAVAKEPGQTPTVAVPKVASPITAPTDSEKQVLRAVYLDTIRPFLAEFRTRRSVVSSPLASTEAARRLFHEKESSLPSGLHPLLNELNQYCDVRRQIEQQRRVLRWMHWWLMVHVPASMVLIVFLVAHVIMALRVIPF